MLTSRYVKIYIGGSGKRKHVEDVLFNILF